MIKQQGIKWIEEYFGEDSGLVQKRLVFEA